MLQNAVSDQGLHCLQLIQVFQDTSANNLLDLLKGKELMYPITREKYSQ